MRRRGGTSATAALLAVACLALAATPGCRDDDASAPAAAPVHHLDTPDLAGTLVRDGRPGVPVLCYHYFRKDFQPGYLARVLGSVLFGMPALGDREFWTTPHAEFERHLAWFRDTGTRVMTLDEVADLVEAGRPLPARAVVLTIDDADRSVYTIAWPLLRKYGVRAHLFVPTGEMGTDWSSLDVCTPDELREMADSGAILVESHTRNLHWKVRTTAGWEPVFWHPERVPTTVDLAGRDALVARWTAAEPRFAGRAERLLGGALGPVAVDLVESRLDVLEATGRAPRWLAWPYGFANGALDSLARSVGFRGTVSLRPAAFSAADSSLAVGRVALTAKSTLTEVAAIWPPAGR